METEAEPPRPSAPAGLTGRRKFLVLAAATGLAAALVVGIVLLTRSDSRLPRPAEKPTAKLNSPKVELTAFASGLPDTTSIVSRSGDDRLFVLSRSGVVRVVGADGQVAEKPFLDISGKVLASGEMGLLGLAFSPDFQDNRYFFINYVDKQQNTVIARYQASNANEADPASEQKVLTLAQPYTNHNGGELVFGPDNYLYAALGDGGSGGDPEDRAQNLNTLLGKILRLDVSELPYKIPPSNPFLNQTGKKPEIWSWGHRNPWRFSFDRQTKEMFIADVGQGDIEEINLEPAGHKGGLNYGWRCYEGSRDFNLEGCGERSQYVFPILEYDHSENRCSVTGGYVYRGQKYPALIGKYFYGDFCGGQIYYAEKTGGSWQAVLASSSNYQISTFGQDSAGELYLADFASGNIYQLADSAN